MDDISRPVATERDTPPNITINEAIEMYSRAGHPRTPRSIQRYCATGHLDCIKEQTSLGDKYFINPTSVERHIAQISELVSLEDRAPSRDLTRHVASAAAAQTMGETVRQAATQSPVVPTHVASEINPNAQSSEQIADDAPRHSATTGRDWSRHDAAETQDTSRYVAQLEREVERADEDRTFLRGQIKTKDEQIAALLERDKETNFLVRGLQQMLSPLLGAPRGEANDDLPKNVFQ